MIEIAFSSAFLRAFKKKIKDKPNLEDAFYEKLQIFIHEPYSPILRTHKLSGELDNVWSFSVNYQIRVTFHFVDSHKAILENIGSHQDVY
jgi:mRNA-degrading endonuclease YafQ of YafQ-DinJ toxin-antitoxin module